jgi:glutaredoxin-related protein
MFDEIRLRDYSTVPLVFVKGKFIGGNQELQEHLDLL